MQYRVKLEGPGLDRITEFGQFSELEAVHQALVMGWAQPTCRLIQVSRENSITVATIHLNRSKQ